MNIDVFAARAARWTWMTAVTKTSLAVDTI